VIADESDGISGSSVLPGGEYFQPCKVTRLSSVRWPGSEWRQASLPAEIGTPMPTWINHTSSNAFEEAATMQRCAAFRLGSRP